MKFLISFNNYSLKNSQIGNFKRTTYAKRNQIHRGLSTFKFTIPTKWTIVFKDEERMAKLEEDLKQVRNKAEEADKQYDEVSKKLQITEGELEKAEERGENGEMKIMELEEELKVVATNLKSLEVSEEKANQREIANKEQVKNLTAKLKQAEARAEFAERSVQKLNQEVLSLSLLNSLVLIWRKRTV